MISEPLKYLTNSSKKMAELGGQLNSNSVEIRDATHILSKDGKCTDIACEKCGKSIVIDSINLPHSVKWRTSRLAKGRPPAHNGNVYVHILISDVKSNGKVGSVKAYEMLPTNQTNEFYQQAALVMYNKAKVKYGF